MSTSHSTGYYSVGQAAKFLGVSSSQIRILSAQGYLKGYTLASNHRRLSVASVKAYALGTSEDDLEGLEDKRIIGYCRCSSAGQKESLTRQVSRLTAYISSTYKIPPEKVEIKSEICSSFSGNRKAFFELCDLITEGKVSVVIAEFKNRYSRVPCQLRLLEHIAEKQNCQLVFLDCEENESEEKANMLELIDYINHLSAKSSGRKSALVTTVHLKQETIELITSLSNKGHTQRQIINIVQKLDHRDSKGEKIGRHVLRKYILLNGQVKTILGQSKEEQSNLIQLLTVLSALLRIDFFEYPSALSG